jgi:formylglycine-generating enzyme required for sulfatase activity
VFLLILASLRSADFTVATATPYVTNGFLVAITVTSGGSGYTAAPEVSIVGGDGNGASAKASITNGSVSAVQVINAGSGYTFLPLVSIAPPLASSIESIQMAPLLTLQGSIGAANQIQYREDLGDTNAWVILTNLVMSNSVSLFVDVSAPPAPKRFYRIVYLPALPPVKPPSDGLVWIPAGSFIMGSPPTEQSRSADEGPQTQAVISRGFWMSEYEVTQGQYLAVTGSNPSAFHGDTNLPVDTVSYLEATNYCAKLTEQEQAGGRLPQGYVYRLPTEAEWEYACRAGTITRFSYGDDPNYSLLGNYAWTRDNTGVATEPVGRKLPNAWGLYDMYGNVYEWCLDWYGTYPGGTVTDYTGRVTGANRVFRGGSVRGSAAAGYHRSAARAYTTPTVTLIDNGVRVVLAPPLP